MSDVGAALAEVAAGLPAEDSTVRRRYLAVADGVLAAVGAGRLSMGDRLPNERELARLCNTSRTTVRDALLALELLGVVEVRPGSGCYISGLRSPQRIAASVTLDSLPRDLLDARLKIEPIIARSCSGTVDRHEAARLRALIDECAAEADRAAPGDVSGFLRLSHQFHSELALNSDNVILSNLVRELVDVGAHPLWQVVNAMHVRDPDTRAAQIAEHRDILAAVESGDGELAAAQMARHLGGLQVGIFGAVRPGTAIARQRPRSR